MAAYLASMTKAGAELETEAALGDWHSSDLPVHRSDPLPESIDARPDKSLPSTPSGS